MTPGDFRRLARAGTWTGPTAGCCPGFVQANLVILRAGDAGAFRRFCELNPRACPLVEVTDIGSPEPRRCAPGADIRTDLPRYRVFRDGLLEGELTDVTGLWTDDMVGFLIGCSFTFEAALLAAGVPVRHIEEGTNVPMFVTDIGCEPAQPFAGPVVVSMRPIPADLVDRAVAVTARYPRAHGAPLHIGDPAGIGIADVSRPDFGDAVTVRPGEVPVFWACGVTPQAALLAAKPELAITHAPGHMFITDLRDEDFRD